MHLSKDNLHVHMHAFCTTESVFCTFAVGQSWLGIRQPELLCSSSCVSCVPKAVPLHNVCVFDISEHCCLLPREVSSLWCLRHCEGLWLKATVTLRFTCTTPPFCDVCFNVMRNQASLKLALHACPVTETQPSRTQWGDLAECLQSDHTVHYVLRIQRVMHRRVCWDHRKSRAVWIRVT